MNNQITYADKVALNKNSSIPDINKVNADDMNEIKAKHNGVMNGSIPMGNVVVDSIRSKNMLDINTFVKGRINTTTGNPEYPERVSNLTIGSNSVLITTTQSWGGIHSQYIEVNANETYNLSFTTTNVSSSWGGLVCYGSSFNYLGEATKTTISSSTNASYNFTLLANTKYVRVVLQNTTATTITYSNLQFEKGNTTTTYAPYQNLGNIKPVNYVNKLTPLANISFNPNKQIYEKNSEGLVIVNLTFVANENIDMVGNADLFQLPLELNPSANIILTIASTTQNLVNTAYIRTANATIRGKLNATINQGSEISLIGSYYI